MICHILGFLGIKDHSRFSLACKEYYEAFGITKIECDKGAEVRYDDFANRYTVLQGHHHRCRVLKRVVGLNVVKYTGTTRHVKELIITAYHKYIRGDTIRYTPKSLTGEGLKYLVKLDIAGPNICRISDVRFERLVTLRAGGCSIIRCKFDVLENLDLDCSRFLSEMPSTIKTLRVEFCKFSDDCVKEPLVNLVEIYSRTHDFMQYAPNVKRASFHDVDLYNLPESLEYLKLCSVEVYGDEFHLPNLRRLEIKRSIIGRIVAPRLSELTVRNTRNLVLDCPVLDVCNIYNVNSIVDIHSVLLMTDRVVDPKKFPKMRALYFYSYPRKNLRDTRRNTRRDIHEDLGDIVYELDMIYIDRVTVKITSNIKARVLVTLKIDKDVDLRKMSRLELIIAPIEYAAIVPAPIKFMEFNHARHSESGFIDLFRELFPDPSITAQEVARQPLL